MQAAHIAETSRSPGYTRAPEDVMGAAPLTGVDCSSGGYCLQYSSESEKHSLVLLYTKCFLHEKNTWNLLIVKSLSR